jgi:hypothetical protein
MSEAYASAPAPTSAGALSGPECTSGAGAAATGTISTGKDVLRTTGGRWAAVLIANVGLRLGSRAVEGRATGVDWGFAGLGGLALGVLPPPVSLRMNEENDDVDR